MLKLESIKAFNLNNLHNKKITIVTHKNPDGDAIGSSLGLYFFLKKFSKDVHVVVPNELPEFLKWMPDTNKILVFETQNRQAKAVLEQAEVIFCLDFNAMHRMGEDMGGFVQKLSPEFYLIDHHEMPDTFAKYLFSDTSYGSTCEMVLDVILESDKSDLLDANIATCLYTGIVTDSGSFRFPKTTAATHKKVSILLQTGIDNVGIHNQLFNSNSYNSLQLLGKALQNLKMPTSKVSYIALSHEELNEFQYQKGDTESIVNYGLSIKGIVLTAFFMENVAEKIIKISFRSVGNFDVNQFARNHFNGGGHKNAAGGKSTLSLQETIQLFQKTISQYPELCT
jgi:phosphoesterase RecJ-like protein